MEVSPTDPASSALAELQEAFAGRLVLPGDAGYDAARAVWNGMIDRRPAVVAWAAGVDDVVTALRFARRHELAIAVRSGGHSIPGFSTCDGGIVIDMRALHDVEIDADRRVARVGGGALLAKLDDAAQAAGLVCPVGVVSHTGVAGLTLGGGMGRLQRKLGLTIDSLLAVELVTAEGEVVRASEDEHADLFWGLRGAGSNFGIATAFEFRLHPLDPDITAGLVIHPIENAPELATVFRELADGGSRDVMVTFGLGLALPAEDFGPELAGRPIALVNVRHYGEPEQARRELAPLLQLPGAAINTVGPKTYLEAQHAADDAMEWGHRFYMKSAFTGSFPDAAVALCAQRLAAAPPGSDCSIAVWAWGGEIARVPEETTAFTGRDARYWVAPEAQWDDPAIDLAVREWVREALADMTPFMSGGRYVNDQVDTGEDMLRAIYGGPKYDRLVALKRAWDPDNVFRLNQNIRP